MGGIGVGPIRQTSGGDGKVFHDIVDLVEVPTTQRRPQCDQTVAQGISGEQYEAWFIGLLAIERIKVGHHASGKSRRDHYSPAGSCVLPARD